jgi:hypothetical protein
MRRAGLFALALRSSGAHGMGEAPQTSCGQLERVSQPRGSRLARGDHMSGCKVQNTTQPQPRAEADVRQTSQRARRHVRQRHRPRFRRCGPSNCEILQHWRGARRTTRSPELRTWVWSTVTCSSNLKDKSSLRSSSRGRTSFKTPKHLSPTECRISTGQHHGEAAISLQL